MNRGLKKYTKQLTQTVGNAGTVSVNINKDDANMHMILPVLKTIGLAPIELKLIYNYQDRSVEGLFGKGFKLNVYSKLMASGNDYKILNADGSQDFYTNGCFNRETNLVITAQSDGYNNVLGYQINDRKGNIVEYSAEQTEYPKLIKNDGETFTLDFIKSYPTIENGRGDLVRFITTKNRVERVVYSRNEAAVLIVEFTYDNDGRLISVVYTDGTGRTSTDYALNSTSIIYGSNTVSLKDNISAHFVRVAFDSLGKATTIEEGFGNTFLNERKIALSYAENKTTVTNAKNNSINYLFDSEGLPLFQVDSQGIAIETEVDKDTKRLLAKSSPILANCSNTIYSGKASYFSNNGVTVIDKFCTDDILNKFINAVSTVKGSGTLTCEVPYLGLPGDSIMAVIWGKQLKPLSQGKVSVSLSVDNETDTDFFKKDTADSNFDFLTLGVTANKSFSKIVMQINLENSNEIELCGIHILKKKYGSAYKYDDYGNCTEVENTGKTMALRYNEKSLLTDIIGADSLYSKNEYNNKNKVERSITAFGTTITNVYDDFNHLVKTTMQTADNSQIMETTKTYTPDGRFVESVTNEMGKTTKFTHDKYGRVIKVLDAMGCAAESNYADNGLLIELILGTGSESRSATYRYYNNRQIMSIALSGSQTYEFNYNDRLDLSEILLNETVLYQFEYDELGNVIAEKYGFNLGKMLFEYNKFGNIATTKYLAPNSTSPQIKYKYEYDSLQMLTRVVDGMGKEIVKYTYDHDGKRISEIVNGSVINNNYDIKGDLVLQARQDDNEIIYQSFERADRSKSESPQSLIESFGKENYLCFFEGHAVLTKGDEAIIPKVTDERILEIHRDGFLPFINTWSSQLSYTFNKSFSNKGFSVQFWFKPENLSAAGNLFYCTSTDGRVLQVYYQSKKLVLSIDGSEIKTVNEAVEGWNFMSINVVDDNGRNKYCLTLNGRVTSSNTLSLFELGSNPQFFIGSVPQNGYNFRGQLACMMISLGKTMPQNDIYDFYRLSKDYIIEKSAVNNKSIDFSETVLYTTNNTVAKNYDIFPLHSNYTSLKGTKPILAEKNVGSQLDKDRSFHFNLLSRSYAYVADGRPLVYGFNHTNEGAIFMRAYISQNVGKQYFFEGKDTQGNTLGLYKASNGKLCVDLKDTIINTGLIFNEKKWQTIGLTFGTEVASTSLSSSSTRKLCVYLDKEVYETVIQKTLDFTGLSYSIGRTMDKTNDSTLLDGGECYPLYGQIEMLTVDSNYCPNSKMQYLTAQLNNVSCVTERDEFGLLKRKGVQNHKQSIWAKNITYKRRSQNSKYYSKVVEAEDIWIGANHSKRSYVTDDLGRITSITDTTFGGHTYEYDSAGRIIKDDGKSIFYDKNGNITNLCGVGMEYGDVTYSLISKADGSTVRHDAYCGYLVSGWKDRYFDYFRNQLIKFGTTGAQYQYTYNHLGQRISKIEPNGTTQYVYSGLKLFAEITDNYRLDFLYDENDELFGFVENNVNKYFYIKDILDNIIGIVDENGTLVGKYSYTAFGKTTVTLNQFGIASLNPFRFKCCYQDYESGMYFINGRYYIPEWGRWLTYDKSSIDFMSVGKHNPFGLNTLCPVTYNPGTEIPAYNVPKNEFTKFIPSWESKWFATNKPDFGNATNNGVFIVDTGLSVFKGTLVLDEEKVRSLYFSFGNLGAFAGTHIDKGLGVFNSANVAAIGYDGKYIDIELSLLTANVGVAFKDGEFKSGGSFGWFGFSIGVDINAILEKLFGG